VTISLVATDNLLETGRRRDTEILHLGVGKYPLPGVGGRCLSQRQGRRVRQRDFCRYAARPHPARAPQERHALSAADAPITQYLRTWLSELRASRDTRFGRTSILATRPSRRN
jgi:hypothetical protein